MDPDAARVPRGRRAVVRTVVHTGASSRPEPPPATVDLRRPDPRHCVDQRLVEAQGHAEPPDVEAKLVRQEGEGLDLDVAGSALRLRQRSRGGSRGLHRKGESFNRWVLDVSHRFTAALIRYKQAVYKGRKKKPQKC